MFNRLDGERIGLIRWNDDPETMIQNALQPASISRVILDPSRRRARVVVTEDQLSLTVGRRGVNRDLASRICGWEIEILTG